MKIKLMFFKTKKDNNYTEKYPQNKNRVNPYVAYMIAYTWEVVPLS